MIYTFNDKDSSDEQLSRPARKHIRLTLPRQRRYPGLKKHVTWLPFEICYIIVIIGDEAGLPFVYCFIFSQRDCKRC